MKLHKVTDPAFRDYGQIHTGYETAELIAYMQANTEAPPETTIYVPSDPAMEAMPVAADLRDRGFGGLDIQIGYCNGAGESLTCFEYHRTSEIDIACTDMILLLARQPEMDAEHRLGTDAVRAFFVPAGTVVELYATTLHYAPSSPRRGETFRMACVLPRGTNTAAPSGLRDEAESRLIAAKNKWLIASEGTAEAADGAFAGIHGPAIRLWEDGE